MHKTALLPSLVTTCRNTPNNSVFFLIPVLCIRHAGEITSLTTVQISQIIFVHLRRVYLVQLSTGLIYMIYLVYVTIVFPW